VVAISVCFDEAETARVLWMLDEASVLAESVDAISLVALFESTFDLVKARFDERGEE
jgi:hypothetical protein